MNELQIMKMKVSELTDELKRRGVSFTVKKKAELQALLLQNVHLPALPDTPPTPAGTVMLNTSGNPAVASVVNIDVMANPVVKRAVNDLSNSPMNVASNSPIEIHHTTSTTTSPTNNGNGNKKRTLDMIDVDGIDKIPNSKKASRINVTTPDTIDIDSDIPVVVKPVPVEWYQQTTPVLSNLDNADSMEVKLLMNFDYQGVLDSLIKKDNKYAIDCLGYQLIKEYNRFIVLKILNKDINSTQMIAPPLIQDFWNHHQQLSQKYQEYLDLIGLRILSDPQQDTLDRNTKKSKYHQSIIQYQKHFGMVTNELIWDLFYLN